MSQSPPPDPDQPDPRLTTQTMAVSIDPDLPDPRLSKQTRAVSIGKTELIRRVAAKTGKSNKETADLVNETLEAVRDALKAGEEVRLMGFGSFSVKTTAARTGVNPQTRARIQVPSKRRVRFSPSKELNDEITL